MIENAGSVTLLVSDDGTQTGPLYWDTVDVTLTTDQDDYDPDSVSNGPINLRIRVTVPIRITGFKFSPDTRVLQVSNSPDSTATVTLPHQSASSSPSNRINSPTSWDEVLNPGESRLLEYDATAASSTGRWVVAKRVAGPAAPSSGIPAAASVSGAIAVDTTSASPSCGALYVYYAAAWHHTAGGGLDAKTADWTFASGDYTELVKIRASDGYHTATLPTTSPLDACWHAFLYNDSSGGTPGTLRINTEAGSALWGYVFVGGGGYVQSDGSGGYYGFGVEQYRFIKTVSGSTYTVLASDENKLLDCTNAAGCAVTVPQASATGNFPNSFRVHVRNSCAGDGTTSPYGAVTITPTTSTIDGKAALTVFPRETVEVVSDATNYKTERGRPPAGIVEWSASTLNLDAHHNGKLLVYTGSGTTTISGDANLKPGFRCGIRNAGSAAASLVQYSRADGGTDYIPPSRASRSTSPTTTIRRRRTGT